MSKSIEQKFLSSNGGKTFYLQLHIRPWMEQLPWFKSYRLKNPNRKNVKRSLKTRNLHEALIRLDEAFEEMGLVWVEEEQNLMPKGYNDHVDKPSENPEIEYFKALEAAQFLPDSDLEHWHEIITEKFEDDIQDALKIDQHLASKLTERYKAHSAAISRMMDKEDSKFSPSPHRYEVSLNFAKTALIREYKADHRDKKTIGKVSNAVKKFLGHYNADDIPLNQIKLKHVRNYIRFSRDARIPLNTFSAELTHLEKIYDHAITEGFVSEHKQNPFAGHRPLKGFKKKEAKAVITPEQTETLAKEAHKAGRVDILVTTAVSYYTGMRSTELYECQIQIIKETPCFSIENAKTTSSNRLVPIHPTLLKWLNDNEIMPPTNSRFCCSAPSKDAFNKRFNRFCREKLVEKHNVNEANGKLGHHSFRHGMSTRLFESGLSELQVAHVVGHDKGTAAQTTSGKEYIKTADVPLLFDYISRIKPIKLPDIENRSTATL